MAFGTEQHFPHKRLHVAVSLISWTMRANHRKSGLIIVSLHTKT